MSGGGRSDPAWAGPEGILGSMARSERLARALAMGVPAFMRRARALEAALEDLHRSLAAERARRLRPLLPPARLLAEAAARGAGLNASTRAFLEALRAESPDENEPRREAAGTGPGSSRPLRVLLGDLAREVQAFNEGWSAFLESVPLEAIRRAQEGYNRYYPIERELALPGAPPVPFKEVPLLERWDLLRRYPLLPAP
jgi:hypothetical protein